MAGAGSDAFSLCFVSHFALLRIIMAAICLARFTVKEERETLSRASVGQAYVLCIRASELCVCVQPQDTQIHSRTQIRTRRYRTHINVHTVTRRRPIHCVKYKSDHFFRIQQKMWGPCFCFFFFFYCFFLFLYGNFEAEAKLAKYKKFWWTLWVHTIYVCISRHGVLKVSIELKFNTH